MRVCVIGTGYVGLVTGVCLAHIGHSVICVDNNEEKVKLMKRGQSPIFEPGLSELMQSSASGDLLEFTTDLAYGVESAEVLFIAVGTPPLPSGESDTRYIEAVAKGIGSHLNNGYKVIVNKSTVPIGSGDWVRLLILDGLAQKNKSTLLADLGIENLDINFDVVSNPEFLREGSAIYDTFNPDRIVLGSDSKKAIEIMRELYQPIIDRKYAVDPALPSVPFLATDLHSAEMIKYAANAFLATKISFVNEIANICDRVGADVTQVAKGMGLDSRIGGKFLQAGLGWGGSCFGKDVSALIHTANDYGYQAELLKSAVLINNRQRLVVIDKLQQELKILKGKIIGILGLTFKPDTDDMRDAPSLNIIEQLKHLGVKLKAYDPIVSQSGLSYAISGVNIETDAHRLAESCDAIILVTDWQEFLGLDYAQMAKSMNHALIVDGRNFLNREELEEAGFRYVGIGR
jgi:UDPglucose 6-dehydrogenase